ncbi:sulfatase-like hydrolase/transferase [Bacteroides cellulosilyticus]|uniref:sulfatase-like hydrolase/transferase n=1 Tax=Bacteroides cellulosilyticus TaxID=246787 RepID=UPI001C37A58D|nr:sulfatase-like hydrolase/transferase [Bacteroides cellulosilyticus]MBV3638538.1 sulfatase-like hydrolase/transferase [Bacteroides cellulosilyticus]MBV3664301.1 sulfatase-like hydrolase/transferase [Bacteroides cellulosilyticus]MBV3686202.1 sulfatase-like hydrolase/transferase [Bacteroides cellulosilyticus]MBV3694783.1 sulfatase-like hydrolase/transferase [Bacteroides cellulosilyticus]MBV3708499.1 sulfatase-like hydrolase/transferase [Bacteroides cellulosilyticus]
MKKEECLLKIGLYSFFTIALLPTQSPIAAQQQERKNILFLMADDFNYWTSALGYHPQSKTPNIDKLAAKGVMFTDAHCSSPVSNPSRNALWSGYRPTTTGIMNNSGGYVRNIPGFENTVTMNQYFMQQGYWVYGAGKLYHPSSMKDAKGDEIDQKNWSQRYTGGTGSQGGNYLKWKNPGWETMTYSVNPAKMTTENCPDFQMATEVAQFIRNYESSPQAGKPFFIGCGVFRPHLPWNIPKEFWNLFKTEDIELPKGYKKGALADLPWMHAGADHQGVVEAGKWQEAIHAYLASQALADYNIGLLLDALEDTPYAENTIVCFMGDHGWHLGEKERWGKNTLFDQGNHTTLIIYDPSAKGNGKVCRKVVSLQDIYPTLMELSGIPVKTDIEGNSLAPLLDEPSREDWEHPVIMAYSGTSYIKTNQWRYVRDTKTNRQMLFNVADDPYEHTNLRYKTGYEDVLSRLDIQLDSLIGIGQELKRKRLANYSFIPTSHTLPGILEAEDYDEGAEQQTYHDNDIENKGGAYRTEDGVDIYITDDLEGGSFHISDIASGEWWKYTVEEYVAGEYNVHIRVKNASEYPMQLHLHQRTRKVGSVEIPPTDGWKTFVMSKVELEAERNLHLTFSVEGAGSDMFLNWFRFESIPTGNINLRADSDRKCLINNVARNGYLELDLTPTDAIAQITIYTTEGKEISSHKVPGEQRVMYELPASLAKGHYLIRISDSACSSVEKFIVL